MNRGLVEVQYFTKITHHFSLIYPSCLEIRLKLIKGKTKRCQHVTGWTWKTLGPRPLTPKIIPGHKSIQKFHNHFDEPVRKHDSC